jgi:hypothetical protein
MTNETEVTIPEKNLVSRDREEIVEDVVMDPPEPEVPEIDPDDPRAAIYARHNEKREQEIEAGGPILDENAEIPAENEQIAVESDDSTAIIDPTPAPDTPSDSGDMVTVKIDGRYREVPRKKVEDMGGIENYQIRIQAQEQMERNAHERRALEARQAELDERERRAAATPPAIPATDSQTRQTPDRSTQPDGQNLEEMARHTLEAVYDDADEAPQRLVQTVQAAVNQAVANAGRQGEPVDREALRKQIRDDILKEQRQAKVVKASNALISAHPELNSRDPSYDERLWEAVNTETDVIQRQNPYWEPEQIIQEAYDRVQKWRGSGGNPALETMSTKQAQKRAMNRPRAGTQRHQPPPPAPRPSNSDYVQRLREQRGQE